MINHVDISDTDLWAKIRANKISFNKKKNICSNLILMRPEEGGLVQQSLKTHRPVVELQ